MRLLILSIDTEKKKGEAMPTMEKVEHTIKNLLSEKKYTVRDCSRVRPEDIVVGESSFWRTDDNEVLLRYGAPSGYIVVSLGRVNIAWR